MWLLKVTLAIIVFISNANGQYGGGTSSGIGGIRGGPISPYGIGYGGSEGLLYGYGMPNPYGAGIGSLYGGYGNGGYGNGIYPGIGGGLGSMIGYPGYGMGSGLGYGGLGIPGYGGGISPYGPMDYSSVYSGSTLGSPWNPYGSMMGGFGTDASLGSLVRPFTARQKESSSKATVKQ